MKECFSCKKSSKLSSFPNDKAKHDGKSSYCFECKRRQESEYVDKYRSHRQKQWTQRKKRVIKATYLERNKYLKTHPCVDCGEADIRVLEFDHLRDKVSNVSKMILRGNIWKTVLKEIEKCEVVCCNCHRRRTAKQFNWFSYL